MSINIAELKEIIKYTNPMKAIALQAKHGIGKSSIVNQIGEELGYEVINVFAGQNADAGDVCGLPDKKKAIYINVRGESIEETITSFAPTDWWPRNASKPIILFIDEANRAQSASVYACLYDLILNQKLKGRELPKGSRVMVAFNPVTENNYYQVEEFDPALFDRFLVYDFEPTFEEWEDYAIKSGYDMRVVNYIRLNKGELDPYINASETPPPGKKVPSRRSWETISEWLVSGFDKIFAKKGNFVINTFSGAIGKDTAVNFHNFLKKLDRMINVNDVFSWKLGIDQHLKTMSIADQAMTTLQVFEMLNSTDIDKTIADNIEKFLNTIEKENAALFYTQLQNRLNKENTQSMYNLCIMNNGILKNMTTLCKSKLGF